MTTAGEPTAQEVLTTVLTAIKGIESRMERLESRMEGIESRMDRLEARVDRLAEHTRAVRTDVADLSVRMREPLPVARD